MSALCRLQRVQNGSGNDAVSLVAGVETVGVDIAEIGLRASVKEREQTAVAVQVDQLNRPDVRRLPLRADVFIQKVPRFVGIELVRLNVRSAEVS